MAFNCTSTTCPHPTQEPHPLPNARRGRRERRESNNRLIWRHPPPRFSNNMNNIEQQPWQHFITRNWRQEIQEIQIYWLSNKYKKLSLLSLLSSLLYRADSRLVKLAQFAVWKEEHGCQLETKNLSDLAWGHTCARKQNKQNGNNFAGQQYVFFKSSLESQSGLNILTQRRKAAKFLWWKNCYLTDFIALNARKWGVVLRIRMIFPGGTTEWKIEALGL